MTKHILLLHGAFANATQFEALSPFLSDYHVHSLHFNGHHPEVSGGEFSIQGFAEQVYQWLQTHNLPNLTILGYSMGGYVAAYLVTNYQIEVEKIITLSTKWIWTEEAIFPLASAVAANKVIPPYMQHFPPDFLADLQTHTLTLLKNLAENPPLLQSEFANIKIPFLIATGEKDKLATAAEILSFFTPFLSKMIQTSILANTPHILEKMDLAFVVQNLINNTKN